MENKIYRLPTPPFIKKVVKFNDLDDCEGYGVNNNNEWTDANFGISNCQEATQEEWDAALIKEAKRRFKKGDVIEKLFGWNIGNAKGEAREVLDDEFYCHYVEDNMFIGVYSNNLKLFEDGVWAKVI